MGGNNSRSNTCLIPVDCEPYVEVVANECEKAGQNALDSGISSGIDALLGPDLGSDLINIWNTALENNSSKWNIIYPDIVLGFKNYEGFKEGASNNECVECSCSDAARKIIERCKRVNPVIPDAVTRIVTSGDNLLPSSFQRALNNEVDTTFRWDTISSPGLFDNINNNNIQETFNNKETFDNNDTKLYTFVKNAIQYRHAKFKTTSDKFDQECKDNSYYSLKNFMIDEKEILDKLHKYYTTFVDSYESLFIHRETISRIINSKLDELEKIQSKIDSYKTNLHVDNRKNNYQSNNYDFYKDIRKYMLILYYSLFILYLIFSKFFSEKQYTNKKILLVLAIYLLIPIILSYAINLTYEGYIYFLESNNIKEDTKSYADIIKA